MTGESWPAVCATAHRHLPEGSHSWVRDELGRVARKLRDEHGTRVGISGMAIGGDLYWAQAVLNAGLDLHAYVPFPQQPDRWPAHAKATWQRLLDRATVVHYTADHYDVRFLHERNDEMIDASVAVVAVWDPTKLTGGTASAVRKATTAGRPIVLINPAARTVGLLSRPVWTDLRQDA